MTSLEAVTGGYVALFLVMTLAWAGFPIAGQAALVAAGVLAGQGELAIEWVLVSATVGSALGGAIGYWIGFHGRRALRSEMGPLRRWRRRELLRGERLMDRYGRIAVFIAPMWVTGVYGMNWRTFLPWSLLAALSWTLVTALGGFFIGPPMARALGIVDAAIIAAAAVALGSILGYLWYRRRVDAQS